MTRHIEFTKCGVTLKELKAVTHVFIYLFFKSALKYFLWNFEIMTIKVWLYGSLLLAFIFYKTRFKSCDKM